MVLAVYSLESLYQEDRQEGLRAFEFPNDQPNDQAGADADLFRQGLTNGTVLNLFPG